jgi:hypothetical protein
MSIIEQAGPWLVIAYAVLSALAALFTALGKVPSPGFAAVCQKIASVLGVVAMDVQEISSFIFGSAKKTATKFSSCLALGAILLCASGCISSAPVVPVTAANSAQIAVCQQDAVLHNATMVAGLVLGGADVALPAIAASLPSTAADAKTDLAATAIGTAAAAGVLTAITAVTQSNFSNSQCSQVVGALPAAMTKKSAENDSWDDPEMFGGRAGRGESVTLVRPLKAVPQ